MNIEYSCEGCGMDFSVRSDVADEDLTCPVCQEPVSIGDSDEQDEEWVDMDEDPHETGAVLAG